LLGTEAADKLGVGLDNAIRYAADRHLWRGAIGTLDHAVGQCEAAGFLLAKMPPGSGGSRPAIRADLFARFGDDVADAGGGV